MIKKYVENIFPNLTVPYFLLYIKIACAILALPKYYTKLQT